MPPTDRQSTFICPILVGRDDLLDLADRRLASARAGEGQFVLLAGEAGIGKSRLLGAIGRRTGLAGLSRVAGAAFPGDLEIAGGLLIDLARGMNRRGAPPGGARIGARIEERLASGQRAAGEGDAHRRRRLLVLDLVDLLAGVADDGPVAILLEDLHWADDLSLEVVAQLARRLPELAVLVVGTYRSDELYPRTPMRDWRSRLLTSRLAEEVKLGRLDTAGTATMASALLGLDLPAPGDLVEVLASRCDGIPLHVEELLGAVPGGHPSGDRLRGLVVPDTLREAVMHRAAALSDTARRLADAAAVVGRELDGPFLAEVTGLDAATVDRGLVELVERHFVVRTAAERYDFRHALIRDALHDSLADGARHELHRRIAEAATGHPDLGGDAFLSMHFAGALIGPKAHELALRAARRAAAMSSHREALELFDRAIRFMPADVPAAERAAIFAALAGEAAAIDANAAADEAYRTARELYLDAGDPLAAASLAVPHVAVRHLLGDGLEARTATLREALEVVDAAGQVGPHPVRAAIEAGLSAAYMLDRRLDEGSLHGERAIAIAQELGDVTAEVNAATTLGAICVFAGRMDDGWRLLETSIARARAAKLEAEAARAYRMIGTSASVLVEYDRAERWLREGIDYARRVELWNHHHYMSAHLAHVAWATGDWTTAQSLAGHALADGRGGITTRITCLHVLGYVALARGDWPAAAAALEEARTLGEQMAELQRLSPAIWGLAEAAHLQGDDERAVELSERGHEASARVADGAYLFPFLVTGTRARLGVGDPGAAGRWSERVGAALTARRIPGTRPAVDHARGLVLLAEGTTGRARSALEAALAGWRERGRVWEATWATLDLARCAVRSNQKPDAARLAARARDEAERLGSGPLRVAAEAVLASTGRRGEARDPWAPLTAREFEVARLVAKGLTNPAIAAELTLSPKTVATHVEHILAKLDVGRRAEIAAWVATVGVLHSRPHGGDREE